MAKLTKNEAKLEKELDLKIKKSLMDTTLPEEFYDDDVDLALQNLTEHIEQVKLKIQFLNNLV